VLQDVVLLGESWQEDPGYTCVELSHDLVLYLVPVPHITEQVDQLLHSVQLPSPVVKTVLSLFD